MRVATRTLSYPEPLDLGLTFGPIAHGHYLSSRIRGDEWWHATNSPEGAATLCVRVDRASAEVTVDAWGAGREWIIDRADAITGLHDEPRSFAPTDRVVARLHQWTRGMRVVQLGCVLDVAVSTILEQRVTTQEARRSWRGLVRKFGTRAPGGHPLLVPPTAAVLAELPDWEWRALDVEDRRSATVRRVAREAAHLDAAAAGDPDAFSGRLRAVPGVGVWTTAHVGHVVVGDADAVPVGDWHLPRHVGFALAREGWADDARMLELLEPFRPHRARGHGG